MEKYKTILEKKDNDILQLENALKKRSSLLYTKEDIDNELSNIIRHLRYKNYSTDKLNFVIYNNVDEKRYEVATSFCPLCGSESSVEIFDSEVEAWIFCKLKTLKGDTIKSQAHSDCYNDYVQEYEL